MTDSEAAEFYRDKLVDWMISQDIPTGGGGQAFEDLLEVVGTYIVELRKQHDPGANFQE
jgi:hypothetical protein